MLHVEKIGAANAGTHRLDPGGACLAVELHRPVKVVGVGQGHRVQAEPPAAPDELWVTFNDQVAINTLEAADLIIDGVAPPEIPTPSTGREAMPTIRTLSGSTTATSTRNGRA